MNVTQIQCVTRCVNDYIRIPFVCLYREKNDISAGAKYFIFEFSSYTKPVCIYTHNLFGRKS